MSLRRALLFVTLCMIGFTARAADDASPLTVDGNRAKEYVAYLSTDAMQGRMTCTEGYRKAADWVAAKLKGWELAPAGEEGTYFQNVEIRALDWRTGVPELSVGTRAFLLDDQDFSIDGLSSPGVKKRAEVVFAGYGISAPKKGLDEYEKLDVKDKIVLVFKGSPAGAPDERSFFRRRTESSQESEKKEKTEDWKAESTDLTKIKVAYDKGAAAILFYDPDASTETDSRRRFSRRSQTQDFKPERPFLCFTITERVFRAIMKPDAQESPRGMTRRVDGLRREIKQKRAQSRATGVQVSLKGYDSYTRFAEENKNNIARNVLAKIEGTDPKLKNEFIVVGAHLDHVGMRNGYVYNGADDNASGSAVVMEVARVLKQADFKPRRTLVFCLWCGEERGLIGSYHYTNKPCDGVTMDKVVTYFNLDMVGMGATLGAPGALNFPTIWEVIKRDQDPEVIKKVEPSIGGPGGSDHSGFIRKGIEALALMTRGGVGHPDYHQPEDDTEKIDPEVLRVSGQFVLQGVMNLANETKTNLVIPRRVELYRALRARIANYNTKLPDSAWSVVAFKGANPDALYDEAHAHVKELLKSTPTSSSSSSSSRRSTTASTNRLPKKSISRGFAQPGSVGLDKRLLDLVVDVYGIGRLDLAATDSFMIADGKLSEDGKKMLSLLEERKVVVHLVSPGADLLSDMASSATKPFVVTGDYEIPETLADRLNSRGVLFGVTLKPKSVSEFIEAVELAKTRLGDRKNLFTVLADAKGVDDIKKPLYIGLVDRGWAHNELTGTREHGGLFGGATLGKLEQ